MQQRSLKSVMKVCGRLALVARRRPGLVFIVALVMLKLFPVLLLAALGFALAIVLRSET